MNNDIRGIGKIVAGHDAILLVDAVSGLCADDLKTDDWAVDVAVSGSQKGLMLPPGLSFASISAKARELIKRSNLPKYYLSFDKALKGLAKADTPFTSAVSLIYGLRESIALIKEEGLENVIKRHALMAEASRQAAGALGLELLSKAPSNVATAMLMAPGIDADDVRKRLSAEFGVTVAGGQEKLKGKIIRLAHLGYCAKSDVLTAISALEIVLDESGHKCERGAGVAAAERVFSKQNA